jgi:hypothetical protein
MVSEIVRTVDNARPGLGEKIVMTAAHQVIFNSPVFGPLNQHALYRQENQQATAVFGRERTSAAVSDPSPKRVKVSIPVGGESMELIYCGPALPGWAKPVLKSLPERWGSGPAWDSYRATPTRLHLVVDCSMRCPL